jgi:hypothetical protein
MSLHGVVGGSHCWGFVGSTNKAACGTYGCPPAVFRALSIDHSCYSAIVLVKGAFGAGGAHFELRSNREKQNVTASQAQ